MCSCYGCLYDENPQYECGSCSHGSHWTPKPKTPESPEEEAGREKGNLLHYPDSRHGDVISLALNGDIGFCEGNIIKYVTRWRKKNGLEDLMKAKTYLDRLIRFYKNKPEESYRVA